MTRLGPQNYRASANAREAGFTLVELMVVIVIIGLVSGAVVMTMADPRGSVSSDIDRFAGRVAAARDAAIVAGRPVAVWVSPSAYGFERRLKGQWEPITDGPLASREWSGGTQAQFGSQGRIRVMFDSVGRADQPLEFALVRDERSLRIRMDLNGKVASGD
jgi:general secretion pathway protein H